HPAARPGGRRRGPVPRPRGGPASRCNGGGPGRGGPPMQRVAAAPRRGGDDTPLAAPLSGSVDALAGVGHPPRFFATLEGLGYQLDQRGAYGGHHPFGRGEVVGRFSGKPLLMTEEGAVQGRALAPGHRGDLAVSAGVPPP
ncbi:tetraacyldisaccharide 4'-kinase, partial [Aeromonas dhakensis]|uniref:tetraacyldisaccharide 4'-kinase n=1 Tax=Aeromonas dhakensis TaxID=196024 RepID=UPI000FAEC55C